MEDVAAWKLLWSHVRSLLSVTCVGRIVSRFSVSRRILIIRGSHHLFTADDAGAVGHRRQFLFRSVRIPPIHVSGRIVIPHESSETRDKRPSREVNIPYDVERKPVEGEDDHEKGEVRCELQEVCVQCGSANPRE